MATINDARKLIYNVFITAWNNETPFTLDNEKFDEPRTTWVRLSVRNRISRQHTLGPKTQRVFRREGSIFCQIFIPTDEGTVEGDRLAQLVKDIFEGERLSSDVCTTTADVREVGPAGDMYQFLVETNFTYDEIK